MGRVIKKKILTNTRLLKDYASWIYCEECDETIGYLCYTSYDKFEFNYTCKCGNKGYILLDFEEISNPTFSNNPLLTKGNRLCCPSDQSPLLTILDKKLSNYNYQITCNCCKSVYTQET